MQDHVLFHSGTLVHAGSGGRAEGRVWERTRTRKGSRHWVIRTSEGEIARDPSFPLHITLLFLHLLHVGGTGPGCFWSERTKTKSQRHKANTPKFPSLRLSSFLPFLSLSSAFSHFAPSPFLPPPPSFLTPPSPRIHHHSTLALTNHVRILFRQPGRRPQLRGTFLVLVISCRLPEQRPRHSHSSNLFTTSR